MIDLFIYLLLGTFSGILAGLFGIGGWIVIIPAFFYVFSNMGVDNEILSHMVLGTSLGVIVFSSVASTLSHNNKKGFLSVHFKITLTTNISPKVCFNGTYIMFYRIPNIKHRQMFHGIKTNVKFVPLSFPINFN